MKIIEWTGEIGWDLSAWRVKSDLSEANGDDITVRFSSPGGDIGTGGDIYLALFNYRKENPNSKMILEIGSMAASYGSLISASSVWNTVKVSDISMAMYHNPANFVYGDYQVMEDNATFLKDARGMYVNIYANKSSKSSNDVMAMMDKTTWLMGGQAIIDAGFADELISTESEGDMTMLAEQAKMAYKSVMTKMSSEAPEKNKEDYNKTFASMTAMKTTMVKTEQSDNIIKPSSEGNSTMEVPMDEEELRTKHPDLYKSVMSAGAEKEKETNSARVTALTEMKAMDDYKDIPEAIEVLDTAIMDGSEVNAVYPKLTSAIMRVMKNPARMAAIESPEDITGGNGSVVMQADETIGEC